MKFEIWLTNLSMLERLVDAALMLAVGGVEIVFDAIVWAAWKFFGDVGPFVAQLFVEIENFLFFFLIDGILFDVGVQMVMPPAKRN